MKLLSSVTFAALAGIANARAVLPDCDCDNFVNGLTTDDIGKSACVREQTVGVQGNKRVCYPEKHAYHPGVDQGCPSGTYRCQVSFAPPKFPTCECGSFANLNENGKAPGTTNAAIEAKNSLKRAELQGFGQFGVPFKVTLAAASNTVQKADVGIPIVDELGLVNINQVESTAEAYNSETGIAFADVSVAALGGGLVGAPLAVGVDEFAIDDARTPRPGDETFADAVTNVETDFDSSSSGGFFAGTRSQEGDVESFADAVTGVEGDNGFELNVALAANNFEGESQGDTGLFGVPLPGTNEGSQESGSVAATIDVKETFFPDGDVQSEQVTESVAGGFGEAPAPNDLLGLAGGTVETTAFSEDIQEGAVIDQLAGASAVSFTEGQPDQSLTGAVAVAGREFFRGDKGRANGVFSGDKGAKPEIFKPAAAFNGGPLGGLCVKESQHDVCFPTYKFEQKVGGAEYYGCPEETHRCDVPPAIELSETTECKGGESSSFTFTSKMALSGFSELGSPTYSATSVSIAFAARTNVERPDRGFLFSGAEDAYIASAFCSDSNYYLPTEDFGVNLYYDKETCDGHSAWVVDIPALDFLVNPGSDGAWGRNLALKDEAPSCRLKTAEFKSDVWPLPPIGDEEWNAGYPFVCDATLVKDPNFDDQNFAGFTFARGTRKIDLKPIHSIPLGSVCGKDGLTVAVASAPVGAYTGTADAEPFEVFEAVDFGRRKLGEMPAADRRRKMTDDVEKVKAAIKACAGA